MFQKILKLAAAGLVAGGTMLSLHAQMAQDPLLSRTAAVQPNIVFMFDDSGSMNSTALYQFGGGAGYQGQRGPNNDSECNSGSGCIWILPPTSFYGRSPDVNLIYYDPRVTYARRINADGTFQAAGSTSGISSFDVYFYKPSTFNTYSVASVTMGSNRGSGYPATGIIGTFTAPPTGGTQATATVQTTATQNVAGVTIDSGGRDYNTTPTITFSAPPAGGIQATGTVVTGTTNKLSALGITNRGIDYPATTTITFSAPPAGGVQATGNLIIGNTNKAGDPTPVALGSGYASAPTVTFSAPAAPGVTATGTATITNTYRVATLAVGNPGAGYTGAVTATVNGTLLPGGVPATATVTTGLYQKVTGVSVTTPGFGFPSTVTGVFSAPGGSGTTATANVVTVPTLKVGSITVNTTGSYNNGASSTSSPLTLSPPQLPGGVQATATVTKVSGSGKPLSTVVTINNAGSGYTSPPVVLAVPNFGQVTAASFTVNPVANGYGIQQINLTSQGSGYTSVPSFTISGGSGEAHVVSVDGNKSVTGVTLTNPGLGYTTIPTVSLSAATGSGATINATTSTTNVVSDVAITNAGSGYTSAPTVTISGGGGSGASYLGTMVASKWITGFTLIDPGYGYTSAPTYTLGSFSPGFGAVLTPTVTSTRTITQINMTNSGAGYTSTPTYTIGNAGSGTGFAGTVNMGTTNQISSITVTNAGSGYTSQPTLSLTNVAPGSGATFTVNYNTIPVSPANKVWDGVGTPTTATSYFTPSYLPDVGSPLAAGANASLVYPNTASSTTSSYPKFKNRSDCDATACTWAQEQQNYANWKTYHSTRVELAKTGIGLAFQPLNPTFRLGWSTINGLNNSSTLDKGVRTFSGVVVSDFFTWLYSRTSISSNSTPNRVALDRVGTYYQRKDTNGPWADSPNGNTAISAAGSDNTHATCRRSYAMLMTDGYYNDAPTNIGDVDTTNGPSITSPTSYQYTPIGPYSDTRNGTQVQNSFADVAMKYWLNDLRSDLANAVKPVAGDEAFWQHMNFYAIGLGLIGTLDATNPAVLASLTGSSGSLPPRTLDWPAAVAQDPKSIDDMWHATVNGRGKMLNAKTASELNAAIAQMMSDINGKEGVQAGVAVSTATLTKDTKKYTPTYTPITWNGNVTAYNLNSGTGEQVGVAWQIETLVSVDPTTGKKTFTSIIPDFASRNIVVGNGATSGTRAVPFTLASLTSNSLTAKMGGTVTQNLVDYLRGDPSNEDTSGSSANVNAIFRERLTRLADIVNSTPTFVKDSIDLSYEKLPGGTPGQSTYRAFVDQKKARSEGVLFVGANDGMLHAFRDGTFDPTTGAVADPGGIEVFSYIPYALLPTITQLSDKAYVHRYFVDGPTIETDAYLAGKGRWGNLLFGSTGGGAGAASSSGVSPKAAVFALDVTSLNSSVTTMDGSNVLWEVSSNLSAFAELGYMLTDVQVGMTVGGTWVAIFGNGYESKSCQARLFVVNAETGALIKEINTGSGSCGSSATKNGLGGTRLVLNASKQIIGVYGGDLLGNMWKFNLNNVSNSSWGVDLAGQPLYKTGTSQPITAAPTVFTLPLVGTTDPATGFMVVFGSGKFYEVADIPTTSTQTVYGVWDPAPFGGVVPAGTALSNNSLLIAQTIGAAQSGPDGNTYFTISNNNVDYKGATTPVVIPPRRGWYFDLPNSGQRLVYPLDTVGDRFIIADTISPSNVSLDPCANETGGTGYVYIVDALNGGGPTDAILDTNGDHQVDASDLAVAGYASSADGRNKVVGTKSSNDTDLSVVILSSDVGSKQLRFTCQMINPAACKPDTVPPGGVGPGGTFKSRQWRQLFLR